MDTIHIKGLTVTTKIGAYEAERKQDQELEIDIEIGFKRTTVSDDLETVVDYMPLIDTIQERATSHTHHLIESFGEEIAELALEDPLAHTVSVTVKKPHLIPTTHYVGVTIRRSK